VVVDAAVSAASHDDLTSYFFARVERIKAIAARHGVSVKAAALQFSLANPAVAAVIPGASRPQRLAEDMAALNSVIPAAFWQQMRAGQLVAVDAPLPG